MSKLTMGTLIGSRGEFVLGTARNIYLFVAVCGLVAAIGGLLYAFIMEADSLHGASLSQVPPRPSIQAPQLDPNSVRSFMSAPDNIRFLATNNVISTPLATNTVLGSFTADTPNGLSSYPNDFDILGGKDAQYFDRVRTPGGHSGLRPTDALIRAGNNLIYSIKSQTTKHYDIQVVARDRFGRLSKLTNVSFALTFGPKSEAVEPTNVTSIATNTTRTTVAPSELQQIARAIALKVDPNKTPLFFKAYDQALAVPARCGTNRRDAAFISNFHQVFNSLGGTINASNVTQFYHGLCTEWRRAKAEQQSKFNQANNARNEVIQQNVEARAAATVEQQVAMVKRNAAIMFVGGSLGVFLATALLLAFMAIEKHTRTLNKVIDGLSAKLNTSQ